MAFSHYPQSIADKYFLVQNIINAFFAFVHHFYIVSNSTSLQKQKTMSWRDIAYRATNTLACSWQYALQQQGLTPKKKTKGPISCRQTSFQLQDAYEMVTGKKVKPLLQDGSQILRLPLKDGMFSQYPILLQKLQKSKFIAYRYGLPQHFYSFIFCQTINAWIPLQGWVDSFSLADWMKTFDDAGGMESSVLNMKKIHKFDPINYPVAYWTYFWNQYLKKFNETQLNGNQLELIKYKKGKLAQFLDMEIQFKNKQTLITRVSCDYQGKLK